MKSLHDNPWQIFQPDVSYLDAIYQERLTISPDESRWMGSRGRSTEVSEITQKHVSVRTSQPQGPVEIDWTNPITRGLVFAFNGATPLNSGLGRVVSVSPGVTRNVVLGGEAAYAPSVSGGIQIAPGGLDTLVPVTSKVTISILLSYDAFTSDSFVLADYSASASEVSFALYRTGAFSWTISFFHVGGQQSANLGIFGTPPFRVSITASGGGTSGYRILLNGQYYTTTTNFGSGSRVIGSSLRLLAPGAYPGYSSAGSSVLAASIFSRDISDSEAKSLHENHWQTFKPHQKTLVYERQVPKIDPPKPKVKAMKVVKHVRTKQPQGPVRIDLSNRYGNLHAFVVPGVGELVRGLPLRRGTGVSSSISPYGVTSKHDGTTSGAIRLAQSGGLGSLVGTTTSWTLSLLVYIDAAPMSQYVIGDFDVSINNASFYIYKSGSFWNFAVRTLASSDIPVQMTGATPGWHALTLVHTPGQPLICYANGVSKSSAPTNAPTIIPPGADLCIGTFGTSGLSDFTGKIAYVAIHKFAFSEADVKTFNANPWQIFQPESKTVWVDA